MNGKMRHLTCRVFLCLGLLCLMQPGAGVSQRAEPAESIAEIQPPAAGLLWNRTGLPAVFPLQIRSDAGNDYLLTLKDAATQEAALAAYVEGGAFFRVLVPPGRFVLSFAAGKDWQGDEALFGPGAQTRLFDLEHPLEFRVRGVGIKAGHIVDLRGLDLSDGVEAGLSSDAVTPARICQTLSRVPDTAADRPYRFRSDPIRRSVPSPRSPFAILPELDEQRRRLFDPFETWYQREARSADGPRPFADRFATYPDYQLRSRPC